MYNSIRSLHFYYYVSAIIIIIIAVVLHRSTSYHKLEIPYVFLEHLIPLFNHLRTKMGQRSQENSFLKINSNATHQMCTDG